MSKAKGEITIYHIIDISKVTRFYKLQSSTASAPGVPTTNPPSGWTATEPAYTSGSTNTLYFVDLTEFTNGTFKYSAVSKSSSYEAAKAAYNKAVSTEQFVTNHMELTDDGLVVGNLTGETLQGNVLIDTDSVDIRVGEKVVASYQGKYIYLGKDSADAVIDLCDGTGIIYNESYENDEYRTLAIISNGAACLSGPYNAQVSSGTQRFNEDGTESMLHSSLNMVSMPILSDNQRVENGYVELRSDYRKTIYNNDSSHSYTDVASNITFLTNDIDPGISIESNVSRDDYIGHANVFVSGDYSGGSHIRFMADNITLMGDVSVNNNKILYASKNTNGYWGVLTPEGSDSGWLRTTSSGLIPHAQDSTNGKSSLGSESWPFKAIYSKNIYTKKVNDTITMDTDGDIIIPMGKGYHSYLENGTTTRSLLYLNTSNNTVLGYGGYSNNDGDTSVYGKAIGITSKGAINITSPTAGLSGRAYGVNKQLWSGEWYMNANQTATLSEAVSAQPHGIILLWSLYSNGAASNSDFNYTFIPKYHVLNAVGKGVCCFLTSASMGNATTKYVYVSDTSISGHANNSGSSTDTNSGITKNPGAFVLRRVIGV